MTSHKYWQFEGPGQGSPAPFSSRRLIGLLGTRFTGALILGLLCGCATKRSSESSEYTQIYNEPLSSSGTQFASLPPTVQNTVRAETGSAELDKIDKRNYSGRIIYRIEFENRDFYPPMYVASDGSLLDEDLRTLIAAVPDRTSIVTGGAVTKLSLSDLPAAAVKSIQREAPDAQVDWIDKEVHGDQTTYAVGFKDRLHAVLHVASDGTVLPAPAR